MKKQFLLIAFIFVISIVKGQNCQFAYALYSGTGLTVFRADTSYTNSLYTFQWDFGDGNTGSGMQVSHWYRSMLGSTVCLEVYDSSNALVCNFCDTIIFHATGQCPFGVNNFGSSSQYMFNAYLPPNNISFWDFDDGTNATGDTIIHLFNSHRTYTIKDTQVDTISNDTCISTVNMTFQSIGNCFMGYLINSNNNVSFSATNGASSTVTWDFGDGSTGTGMTTSHTYAVPGAYFACYTSTNTSGNSCSACEFINLSEITSTCSFNNSTTNGVTDFSSYIPNLSHTFTWEFDDWGTAVGTNVQHAFSYPGMHFACMNEIDSTGNMVCQYSNMLNVGTVLLCSFAAYPDTANPLQVVFQMNNSSFNVTWDFGDNTIDTGAMTTHIFPAPGNYNVCAVVDSSGVPTCTFCQNVNVGGNFGNCSINYLIDSLGNYVFSISPTSPYSVIDWDLGDGYSANGNGASHRYLSAGIYQVCVSDYDTLGAVNCQSCIWLNAGSGSCQAAFYAVPQGLTYQFIDMSIDSSNSTLSYLWDFGDGTTSTQRFPQHTYMQYDSITACLTITSGICSSTFCNTFIVDTTVIQSGCNSFYAIVQNGQYNVDIVNLSTGNNLSYLWDFGDGASSSAAFPSHYYPSTGSYILCLTVNDHMGCISTYCDSLNVDSLGNIYRGMVHGFSIQVIAPSGLNAVNENISQSSFSIFPNPVTSYLNLVNQKRLNSFKSYRIYGLTGNLIDSGMLHQNDSKINLEKVDAGLYILEVTFKDGSRQNSRIVKP